MSQFALAQEDFNYLTLNKDIASSTGTGLDTIGGGEADLYQQIANEFNLEYENIGKREAAKVLAGNALSITGGLNLSLIHI